MPGVQLANLTAEWRDGALYFLDSSHSTVLIVSSTGFDLRGGGNIVSTPSLTGGVTVSSGLTLDGQTGSTATGATSLTMALHGGKIVKCATDATFFTLPLSSTTTLQGGEFTIKNTASAGGAQIILITTTTESIIGAGVSTTNLLSNTKATAKPGDYVTVSAAGSSSWYVTGMVGVWASTT